MGGTRLKGREGLIDLPVIVIAGSNDNILPSALEADRLVAALPQCTKVLVRSQGTHPHPHPRARAHTHTHTHTHTHRALGPG
jgi:predicted dienelactone hydrolase